MNHPLVLATAFAALASVAGCASHQPKPPPDASAMLQCRDGKPFTERGACLAHGGIDRQASDRKAQALRQKEESQMGAAPADQPAR